jgi:HK97 family phage portal protein
MFATSKMYFGKALEKPKGNLRNESYMNQTLYTSSVDSDNNALGDIADLEITRTFMTDAYKTCEWIRAIVDRISERVTQVELFPRPLGAKMGTKEGQLNRAVVGRMEKIMSLLMKPNNDGENIDSLKKKVVTDMAIYDQAGIQIVHASNLLGSKIPFSLYANVSGEELFVNPNPNGTLPEKRAYLQLQNGTQEVAAWDKNEFLSFIKNRRAGYANGLSPIHSVAASIMGDLEAMNYNIKFFENNARPDIAFIFENLGFGKGDSALKRAKAWYLENYQGKPHLPLFMGSEKGNVKLQDIKYTHRDMQFLEWQQFLLSRIMSVYGMQPIVLGTTMSEAYNKLDSQVQSDQFKRNAVIPYVKVLLQIFNSGLIWNDDNFNFDDIYLTSTNLDIEDEKSQAEIDEKYLDRGVITINQVRNRLQMPPVSWGALPFVPLNYAPYDTLVKYQQSKIASNIKSQSSDKIDNNVKVEDKSGKPQIPDKTKDIGYSDIAQEMQGTYAALYSSEFDSTECSYNIGKGFPSGTEKLDPSLVKEAIGKIISLRETYLSKFYSIPDNSAVVKNADIMELSWQNILKNR